MELVNMTCSKMCLKLCAIVFQVEFDSLKMKYETHPVLTGEMNKL